MILTNNGIMFEIKTKNITQVERLSSLPVVRSRLSLEMQGMKHAAPLY